MKKNYQMPQMEVVEIKNECQILAGSTVHGVGAPFGYGGGGHGTARSRYLDDWDEWE